MSHNYFEQKMHKYLLNMINKNIETIFKTEAIGIWHEMLSSSDFEFISKEINSFDSLASLIKLKSNDQFFVSSKRNKNLLKKFKSLDKELKYIEAFEAVLSFIEKNDESVYNELAIIIKNIITKKTQEFNLKTTDQLEEIRQLFKLSDDEVEILTLFYCCYLSENLRELTHTSSSKEDISYPTKSKAFISTITEIPVCRVSNVLLSKKSNLISLEILKNGRSLSISDDFAEYLSGHSGNKLMEKYAKPISLEEVLSISNHLQPATKLETLKNILESKQPCSILFYGKPGTGKTELTRTMAKEIGLTLFSINILDDDGEDNRGLRKQSLFAAQNHPLISEGLIVVDECDQLINSSPNYLFRAMSASEDQKAWLNEYLDQNRAKMIWITNSIDRLDESTVRRFNYILEFEELSNLQRIQILNGLLVKYDCQFLDDSDIKALSKYERLTSGHFSLALKTVNAMPVADDLKKTYFINIIKEYQNTLGGEELRLKDINHNYCIKGLNIDQNPETIITYSKKIIEKMELDKSDINLNVLLYGPPGAGKTEFVKYLGQELGKEILLKRASDLLSMYVGGSEKNIRNAFKEAERDKKILFIDEADSLVSPRENHSKSWETTQVNEILTCMENFRGILLCATNHIENLDMAAKRRFLFKYKFDYLTKDGVIHFYEKFFGHYFMNKPTENEKLKLEHLKGLTPSEFNNLKRKFDIYPPATHDEIIHQLKLEIAYKKDKFKKKIGV